MQVLKRMRLPANMSFGGITHPFIQHDAGVGSRHLFTGSGGSGSGKKNGLKMNAILNRIQKEVLNREISRCSYHRFLNRYFTQKVVTWSVDLFKRTEHPKTQKLKVCSTDYLRLTKPPLKE
jgi:hypothetical protein